MKSHSHSPLSTLVIFSLNVLLFVGACAPTPIVKQGPVTEANYDAIKYARKLPDEPGLSFPYKDPRQAVFTHCFALCPWNTSPQNPSTSTEQECKGERHVGIDIYPVPYQGDVFVSESELVGIVAPADAEVFKTLTLGAGDLTATYIVVLKLKSTSNWYVSYSFEPHSTKLEVNQQQAQNILVKEGKSVKKGELIGKLVVSTGAALQPSVHLSLFYLNPSQDWETLLHLLTTNILSIHVSDGTDLRAAGWPWDGETPTIETTFFCPYEFSSPRAKAIYDNLPKYNNQKPSATVCCCLCAYNSNNGDCGVPRPQFEGLPESFRPK